MSRKAKVLVIGSGNMGRRYAATVRELDQEVTMYDVEHIGEPIPKGTTHAIIATPWHMHALAEHAHPGLRELEHVLVEKPMFCTLEQYQKAPQHWCCVNNWLHLPGIKPEEGANFIEYLRYYAGSGTYVEKFIQPIYWADMSRSLIREGKEAVYYANINGRRINGYDVDRSYHMMIVEFINCFGTQWTLAEAQRAHLKAQHQELANA